MSASGGVWPRGRQPVLGTNTCPWGSGRELWARGMSNKKRIDGRWREAIRGHSPWPPSSKLARAGKGGGRSAT
eukprot:7969899-Pyramimonas_sp.AAC.1